MIRVNGKRFADESNRTLVLRGGNLGGGARVPTTPDGDARFVTSLHNLRNVSFVGRPFPLEEADEHYDAAGMDQRHIVETA